MSSGPKTRGSYGPTSPRGQASAARKKMEHAEKYAPGLSLDMEDEKPVKKMAFGGSTLPIKKEGYSSSIGRLTPKLPVAYARPVRPGEAGIGMLPQKSANRSVGLAAGAKQRAAEMQQARQMASERVAASKAKLEATRARQQSNLAKMTDKQKAMHTANMAAAKAKAMQNKPERDAARKAKSAPRPGFAGGGSVHSSASKRADGIAQRGKTRGKMV